MKDQFRKYRILRRITLLNMLFYLAVINSIGQVLINELCASNSLLIADPEFKEYSDWIEIFNSGTSDVDLSTYYITDNLSNPVKWSFPEGTILKSGRYMILWADGIDKGLHTNFRLSALGEKIALFSIGTGILDSVSFSEQQPDISYGRTADGGHTWGYFSEPTPGTANSTAAYLGFVYSTPDFSLPGGMYTASQDIGISSYFGGEIRYTMDGSEPGSNSPLYSSAVNISKTTILRARIYKEGLIPGPAVTQSYFINDNSIDGKLPVISVASDPENFWSSANGIYVQSFKPDWEIPVNIELFENDGSDRQAFNELAGAKINGLYSWQLPQKMLGIYFKKAYGSANIDYPLTRQRKRSSYKNFALRASGSDWSYTLFRDILGQHAALQNMDIEIMGFRPAVVYFNGDYMGIHNIREKVDDDYIEKSFQLIAGSFDMVENEDYAEAGDLEAYNYLLTLLSRDLSDDSNYKAIADLVDIENFTDYVIAEMASGNTSIDHNVMAWKPKESGKWRWILMDLDRGFSEPSDHLVDFYIERNELLLEELIANQSYKEYFAKRLASQLFTSFNAARMNLLIDEHSASIESEIPEHINRWKGTTSSYGNAIPSVTYWNNEVNDLRSFVNERPAELLNDLQNYGFEKPVGLTLRVSPPGAGTLKVNGLSMEGDYHHGLYIRETGIELAAEDHPGYNFSGWTISRETPLIEKGSVWKYRDIGSDPGTTWSTESYNDDSWRYGAGQLGYGDNDENTSVSFGNSSQSKYITTYFRKKFTVSQQQKEAGQFILNLLRDDGAIVYLNGTEIIRSNMDYGDHNYLTRATHSIVGSSEDLYLPYLLNADMIKSGENILAVEIHQESSSSSDISFDLELLTFLPVGPAYFSTSRETTLTFADDLFLTADYQKVSDCFLPSQITSDLVLDLSCSPYIVLNDVTISGNASVTIDPGVELIMSEGVNIFVEGELNVNGTKDAGVVMHLDPSNSKGNWGVISFRNTSKPSTLSFLTIEDASEGPDPIIDRAAISAFNADLVLNHITIEKVAGNPISARYSDITLTNSSLHSEVSGDLINVKYGSAYIENCDFIGNDQPDTDGIDYDEIENGTIRNCRISGFYGFNSDAIDIGERASDILIDSVYIHNITDKGVSLGQRSSATITNSIFINCNMGVALKDSSRATIDHCLFYSNVQSVASFEKNPGQAGGNGIVRNSILSNSSEAPVYADARSTLKISYSLSDNIPLEASEHNLFGNPMFQSPTYLRFELAPTSIAKGSGFSKDGDSDLGVVLPKVSFEPSVMISQFFINSGNVLLPEFIALYNPTNRKIDVSNYKITRGISAILPEETYLDPGGVLYLTDDRESLIWGVGTSRKFDWETGRLENAGEAIQLEDDHGIVIDHIEYANDGNWPADGFTANGVFQLMDYGLDNHFGENWTARQLDDVMQVNDIPNLFEIRVYPNPTAGLLNISGQNLEGQYAELYNLSGIMIDKQLLHGGETNTINLTNIPPGMVIVRIGEKAMKVMIAR